jgi:hypothetical protein
MFKAILFGDYGLDLVVVHFPQVHLLQNSLLIKHRKVGNLASLEVVSKEVVVVVSHDNVSILRQFKLFGEGSHVGKRRRCHKNELNVFHHLNISCQLLDLSTTVRAVGTKVQVNERA